MLDVCFGDSMKGALCIAQNLGAELGGATSITVIGPGKLNFFQRHKALKRAKEERRRLQAEAVPLDGNPEDVVGISFDFSLGDIAAPLKAEGCPRKEVLFQWLAADPWGEQHQWEESAQQFWQNCLADLEKLKTRAAQGEPMRLWADATPACACGVLFVAHLLKESASPLSLVVLPQTYRRPDGAAVEYSAWGEVEPERLGGFVKNAVLLTDKARLELAEQWDTLLRENAPLRAVKNGRVVSAEMDYYDDLIRREYPRQPCRVGELIGNVLAKQRPGVGDWLLAQRIRALIAQGELKVLQKDSERFYNTQIAAGQ